MFGMQRGTAFLLLVATAFSDLAVLVAWNKLGENYHSRQEEEGEPDMLRDISHIFGTERNSSVEKTEAGRFVHFRPRGLSVLILQSTLILNNSYRYCL